VLPARSVCTQRTVLRTVDDVIDFFDLRNLPKAILSIKINVIRSLNHEREYYALYTISAFLIREAFVRHTLPTMPGNDILLC
jgi:hypothetical protein